MTDSPLTTQNSPSTNDAIAAALKQNWQLAVDLNIEISKSNKNDIDALNRLGFAYLKLCKVKEAKKTFEKVISIDRYNQIAVKNIAKLEHITEDNIESLAVNTAMSPLLFLEDPGKTKVVQCVNVAPETVLATLHCGQEIQLKAKNHCVEIRDHEQRYLGALPDDLSFRLIKLLEAENSYQVNIKSIDKNSLTVFIRELARGEKFINQPSFINIVSYSTFSKDIVHDVEKPDTSATGESETDDPTATEEV
jgi:hypothetical protein